MKRIVFLIFLGLLGLYAACSPEGTTGDQFANEPPTVWLSAGPPEGSTGKYRVQMFWGGWDPDGEIAGYEYIVTDNSSGSFDPADTVGVDWSPVAGNDSTFTFSADQPVDTLNSTNQISEFTRSHTFFIRAIDSQGLRSSLPAHRSFTSRTLSPLVRISVPIKNALNPAEVPPISTFRWRAFDYVDDLLVSQPPDSVQWVLKSTVDFGGNFTQTVNYLRDYKASAKDWYPWVWYNAPQDSGKFWTTPPVDLGTYVFAIRAKDEAGAVTPVLDENENVRRIRVRERNSGPIMTVSNDYMGVVRWATCAPTLVILDSPAGVPLEFKISGSATHYGGEVVGYRYGWDIPDLNDPEQWETDLTPFVGTIATVPSRTFFFGTHTLTTEVVDNSGYCTRIQVKVNVVQFTLERNLLIVDDDTTDDGAVFQSGWSNGGVYPNDAEHDGYWKSMASDVAGFDPQLDMVDTKLSFLPLTTLAQYKSIIWSVYGSNDRQRNFALLYNFISHRPKNPPEGQNSGKLSPNVLALAMAAGSHIMVAGYHPIQHVINRGWDGPAGLRFPVIWLYELEGKQDGAPVLSPTVGELSFAYRELCLETMDYAYQKTTLVRPATGARRLYCPSSVVRNHGGASSTEREDTMREALPLDPNFPALALRPEAAGPGQFYDPALRGLDVEVYNPFYYQRNSGQAGSCQYVPAPRSCFQPIYGLGCIDTLEPVYNQPIAFWTSAFADRVADIPGAVGARSVVFGFPPVFIAENEFRPVMDYILFEEWKLPRSANLTAGTDATGAGATPE